MLGGDDAYDVNSLADDLVDRLPNDANDHAANPFLPAWLVKLLSSNIPAPAPEDLVTAHIHFGGTNSGAYVLDLQPSELPSQTALQGQADIPPGHSDDHGADLASPPGHAKDLDAIQGRSMSEFNKPDDTSAFADHGRPHSDNANAAATDLPTEVALHGPPDIPPGHAKDQDESQSASVPDLNKPDKTSAAADHGRPHSDNANAAATDLPTEVVLHGPPDIPPGHAKDQDESQSASVPDLNKPDKTSAFADHGRPHSDNANAAATDLPTQVVLHGPPDIPPGHAKDQDEGQSASVPDLNKPDKTSAAVDHGPPHSDNANAAATDLPTEVALHGPPDIPPGHAKDQDEGQSASVPDLNKPDKTSAAVDHGPPHSDNADAYATDLPTQVTLHGPPDIPPGHAKDQDESQSASVPDLNKPDKTSAAVDHGPPHSDNANAAATDLPTEVALHGPPDIPPGHAKDQDESQSASVPDLNKPDKTSAAVDHGPPHSDNANAAATDLPSQVALHGPPDTPPESTQDRNAISSAPTAAPDLPIGDMAVATADHFVFDDRPGHPDKVELPIQPALDGTPDAATPIPVVDAAGASPVGSLLVPTSDEIVLPVSDDHFHFGNPHAADPQSIVIPIAAPSRQPSDYMAPLSTDQFQFSELNTGHNDPVMHTADFDPPAAAVQTLIDATTPAAHSFIPAVNEGLMVAGMDITSSHGHQGGVHALGGTA